MSELSVRVGGVPRWWGVVLLVALLLLDLARPVPATAASDQLVPSPAALDFGSVEVGSTTTRVLDLTNDSEGAALINRSPGPLANGPFRLRGGAGRVAAGGVSRVEVTFAPVTVGTFADVVEFSGSVNGYTRRLRVSLHGIGTGAGLEIQPYGLLDFGDTQIGGESQRALTIINRTAAPVLVSFPDIPTRGEFRQDLPFPVRELAPGESETVAGIQYRPTGAGEDIKTVSIETDAIAGGTLTQVWRGRGVGELGFDRTRLRFGTLERGVFHQEDLVLHNHGQTLLAVSIRPKALDAEYFTVTGAGDVTIPPGEDHRVSVQFGAVGRCKHAGALRIRSAGLPRGAATVRVSVAAK